MRNWKWILLALCSIIIIYTTFLQDREKTKSMRATTYVNRPPIRLFQSLRSVRLRNPCGSVAFEDTVAHPLAPLEHQDPGDICIHVAYFVDFVDGIIPLATSVASLLENSPHHPLFIHVITSATPNYKGSEVVFDTMERLISNNNTAYFEVVNVELYEDALKSWGLRSSAVSLKVIISQLLPEVDRVIVLDANTVVQVDIAKLYRDVPSSSLLAAVSSSLTMDELLFDCRVQSSIIPGKYCKHHTYHTGVMVANLYAWKQHRKDQEISDLVYKGAERRLWSIAGGSVVPIFNVAFFREVHEIDERWNIRVHSAASIADARGAYILHWTGEKKPWSDQNAPLARYWCAWYPFQPGRVSEPESWRGVLPYRLVEEICMPPEERISYPAFAADYRELLHLFR